MKKYYRFYFEQLARSNKLINHTDGDKSFYLLKDRYDLEAFDIAIKSMNHTPALLLDNYFYDARGGESRNYWKHIGGRFNLLKKAKVGEQATIDDAQALCEAIADELIAKMREDFEAGGKIEYAPGDLSPKVFFMVDSVKVDPIGPIATEYYGVTCSFTLKTAQQARSNPANWQ